MHEYRKDYSNYLTKLGRSFKPANGRDLYDAGYG